MKFFWKLFFTIILTATFCISIAGTVLLKSNTQTFIQNEVERAFDRCNVVAFTLLNELSDFDSFEMTVKEYLRQISRKLSISYMDSALRFSLYSQNGEVLFSSLDEDNSPINLSKVSSTQKGYIITETEKGMILSAVIPVEVLSEQYYIFTSNDINYVFENAEKQFQTLLKVLSIMLLFAASIAFVMSRILMRQIKEVTSTSQKIAAGDLSKRLAVNGEDEFTILAKNFNKMADSLSDKMKELEEESVRKEMFVGAFSHELKTPLTSIIGYSDMLRNKANDPERVKICANYIFTEGKRLETMSFRLLDLLVLKSEEIHRSENEIKEILQFLLPMFESKLNSKSIKLSMDIEEATLLFDTELMKTVFINLIDNGIKASHKNSTIKIFGKKCNSSYKLTIQDEGRGIPFEELTKIKEAFFMVDKSRARSEGGAGLGLSICDMIINRHGFLMNFESIVGKGTTVIIKMEGAVINEK